MARAKIENLMSELHDRFGDDEQSIEQQQLMQAIESHLRDGDGEQVLDPTPLETLELLVERLEERHPGASVVLRDLLETLKNMGV